MKKLTVGYSTLASRVHNLSLPQANQLFDVLVCVQLDGDYAKPKAEIIELDSIGVTKSRNAVIENTQTEYLVFADDDIEIDANGLRQTVEYLDHHQEVSLVLGRVNAGDKPRKNYPAKPTKLTRFNSAKAATPEMVIRVESIRNAGISFDENFGAGMKYHLGDEYIFVSDCLKKGLEAVSLPIVIASHEQDSSGTDWKSEQSIISRAKVFTRVFGSFAFFAKLGFAYKNFRNFGSFKNILKFVITW